MSRVLFISSSKVGRSFFHDRRNLASQLVTVREGKGKRVRRRSLNHCTSLPNKLRVTSMDLGLCLDGLPLPTPMHRCSYFFHPLPIIKSSESTPLYSTTYPLDQTIELSRLNHLYQAHKCNASDEPSRRHVGHRIFRPLFNGRFVLQCTYYIHLFLQYQPDQIFMTQFELTPLTDHQLHTSKGLRRQHGLQLGILPRHHRLRVRSSKIRPPSLGTQHQSAHRPLVPIPFCRQDSPRRGAVDEE